MNRKGIALLASRSRLPSTGIVRFGRTVVAGGVGGVFVAFLLQAGGELLDDLDFKEVPEVCETALGDEEVLDAASGSDEVVGGGRRYGKREGGFGEEFGD